VAQPRGQQSGKTGIETHSFSILSGISSCVDHIPVIQTFRGTFPSRSRQMNGLIEPGMRVRHPDRPEWGSGQVQSVIGNRITVNFENAGKLLINAAQVTLEIVDPNSE